MGIGMNFVCTCCSYDSGILMLNQGTKIPLKSVIHKYIDIYTTETDLTMHPLREKHYRKMLAQTLESSHREMTYNYFACVCYSCNKTYEMLDLLEEREEVYAGDRRRATTEMNPIQRMFSFPPQQWSSLLGEEELCLFCNQATEKITNENLERGMECPKCREGHLKVGDEFEIWD
ncbi:hypothetical protein BEP19_06450 [Ammoniphilus oxalaticus]|uniref:Uncharacterized protein n=1 Tax=Ammoniphilus oxalaticus TaxID=66863 RepID=A0A419SJ83_9BACL|nr:hypothetical protein [Ammoniphilus oxalaticus]RKD24045.1 hypothetical protein BEP19_06450 [Ammoniphilus oxalaticus]